MKVGKENDLYKEKLATNDGLEKPAINVNESHSPKDISARGIYQFLEYKRIRFEFICILLNIFYEPICNNNTLFH